MSRSWRRVLALALMGLAMEAARAMGMKTGALVSVRPGAMAELADVAVRVPSENTARVQESHLLCVHTLCAAVEQAL